MSNETLVFLAFHFGRGGNQNGSQNRLLAVGRVSFPVCLFFVGSSADLLVDIKSLILSKGSKIQKVVKSKTTLVFRFR